MSRAEAQLDLGLPATALHNRVRALAGWPGTYVELLLLDQQSGEGQARLVGWRWSSEGLPHAVAVLVCEGAFWWIWSSGSGSFPGSGRSGALYSDARPANLPHTICPAGTSTPLQLPVLRTRIVAPDDVPLALRPKLLAPAACAATEGGTAPGPPGLTPSAGPLGAPAAAAVVAAPVPQRVHYVGGRMLLPCGDGSLLEVLQVGPGGIKGWRRTRAMQASLFVAIPSGT